MRRIARLLAALGVAVALPALAQDTGPKPYLFSQGHNNTQQKVFHPVPVQVQLPAGPPVWSVVEADTTNVSYAPGIDYFSPGRIGNTSAIQVFDFKILSADKAATIVLRADASIPKNVEAALGGRLYILKLIPVKTGR